MTYYSTYNRLNLHVSATPKEVVRAARMKLQPFTWTDRRFRAARHAFFREILAHHHEAQEMCRTWRL